MKIAVFKEILVPCGGKSPRDFNITSGRLICANEGSDNVCFFPINNGDLTKLYEIQVERPLGIVCYEGYV